MPPLLPGGQDMSWPMLISGRGLRMGQEMTLFSLCGNYTAEAPSILLLSCESQLFLMLCPPVMTREALSSRAATLLANEYSAYALQLMGRLIIAPDAPATASHYFAFSMSLGLRLASAGTAVDRLFECFEQLPCAIRSRNARQHRAESGEPS